jgi:hypothetical protein
VAWALPLLLGACNDGVGLDDGLCSGRIGDPSIATSCVIVEGRVLDPAGAPVASANVTVDCFGPETVGCEANPGETGDDGAYRFMVHDLREEGGPGLVVVRAWHALTDRRAASDTTAVVFEIPGGIAPVYTIDVRLPEG